MKRTLLVSLIIGILSNNPAPCPAQVEPDGKKALAHVAHLASDAFRGRRSGTPEYLKAAEYVAGKMREYGLEPGGDNGTWFQDVPLRDWTNFEPPTRLELTSPEHRTYFPGRGRDFTPVRGTGSGVVRGECVFVGFGIRSPKEKWDDYEKLDVRDKIVLLLPGVPPFMSADSRKEWSLAKKVKLAQKRGAVGIIEMDVSTSDGRTVPRQRSGSLRPGDCSEGFLVVQAGRNVLDDIFYLTNRSWKDLVSKTLRLEKPHSAPLAAAVEMEAHFLSEDRSAPNVIGILPGRDPRLKEECLMIGGHLDHLGVGLDGIVYNGADDNAASVAVILEIARVFAENRFQPSRSIVFAAWAGEELGLRGSRHYTQNPVFPLEKTVLYLNMDMVGTGDTDLYVGGMWLFSELYEIIKSALDRDMVRNLHYRLNYRGSDHTAFWGQGVPAISLRTGNVLTRQLDDEHPEYHYPGDRAEIIDPELLLLACRYHIKALTALADNPKNLLDPIYRTLYLHRDAVVADLHCDTISRFIDGEDLAKDNPKGHIDIPKLKQGAVDLQVFASYVGPPENELEKNQAAKKVFRQIDAIERLVEENAEDLAIVTSYEDFAPLRNQGKTAILKGIEGGYAIENDLALLRTFYDSGVRLMTLTHWYRTDWADASGDEEAKFGGLTEFGESVIREMNRLGMIIDVSHVHDETFWDVIRLSEDPIVASHSCCRALSVHHRNLSDDMIKALAKNGGVMGINYAPGFLDADVNAKQNDLFMTVATELGLPPNRRAIADTPPEAREKFEKEFRIRLAEFHKTTPPISVKTVVDHIDHIVELTGNADHVGLGSDFDGISSAPKGLEHVGLVANITKELVARGYDPRDIRKILGDNFIRVFREVCSEAR